MADDISALKAKLAARLNKPGMAANVAEIRARITELEGRRGN